MKRRFLITTTLLAFVVASHAAEVIPPKPAGYFNDYAGVVSKEAALRFNEQLAQFERETSNQVVVAVFRKMESPSDIADYTRRVAQEWKVGQTDRRNGAVLFVYVDDRRMYIQVGYGLEGAIPDATAFDITERNIKPRFRSDDYEGGLALGIDLLMKAARGEYKGTGQTVAERQGRSSSNQAWIPFVFFFVFLGFVLLASRKNRRRGRKKGYRYSGFGGPFLGGWTSGSGSSSSSSGSSGGGGFSGFSGGGGSFGGGGAGSSW